MSIDISLYAKAIRQLDESTTLKSFIVVLVPFLVLWNLGAFIYSLHMLAAFYSEAEDFPVITEEDVLFRTGFVIIGIVGILAPLGFVLTDWIARRESGRQLAAFSGAMFGWFVFILLFTGIGAFISAFVENEELQPVTVGLVTLPILVAVATWLLTRKQWVRWGLVLVVSIPIVSGLGFVIFKFISEEGLPAMSGVLELLGALLLFTAVVMFVVRFIRLRIILSDDSPRSLLMGELRGGIWTRLAHLSGLPSSMWSLSAIATVAFWMLLLARPAVYIGVAYAYTNRGSSDEHIGYWTFIVGAFLIVIGHVMFWAGKRLAARRIWKPDQRAMAPILFLRSFEDDQLTFKTPRWNLWRLWLDLWSFRRNVDEMLIDEMAQYGPVVALGRPGEKSAPFGAQRYYAKHEDWQTIVGEAARRAHTIVIVAGNSPGVLWEFDFIAQENLIERTVLLFRPGETHRAINTEALDAFTAATGTQKVVIESSTHPIALLQKPQRATLVTAESPSASAYLVALRAHFQTFDQPSASEGIAVTAVQSYQ